MTPLPADITRCYGKLCNQNQSCRRFLTIRIDPPESFSYVTTAVNDNGECDSYIPLTKSCPNCKD
ncbi:hypothetical protein [Methylomonas koyamae]|uniref:hypothetical protein n=1 Tax=Methylomonas koyamae TaxID=702114 RepID=UPI00112946F3|nr:hypothetical protein [Methylomonas koyamae]TPQ24906.1 hypothetical protein C2U68_17160 [Methylomonas koyamae]